jgi:hypothetical protein
VIELSTSNKNRLRTHAYAELQSEVFSSLSLLMEIRARTHPMTVNLDEDFDTVAQTS